VVVAGGSGDAFGSRSADGAMGFLAAIRDAWDKGALAWQMMVADAAAMPGGATDPTGPLTAMLAPWADFARAYGPPPPRSAPPAGSAEAAREALEQVSDLSPALAEAAMIAAISAARYSRALAEICARHQGSVVQTMLDSARGRTASATTESRVLIDDLRACLREIGEAASLEARRLQAELDQVSESLARAAAGDAPPSNPRPYRVKE